MAEAGEARGGATTAGSSSSPFSSAELLLLDGSVEEDDALLEALRAKARKRRSARETTTSTSSRGGGGRTKSRADEGEGEAIGDGDGTAQRQQQTSSESPSAAPASREPRQPRDIFDVPLEDNFTKATWIQLNTYDLLSFYNLMHHAVSKECTSSSCPKMSAGPNFEFLWSEGEHNAKAITMCARDYIMKLSQWAHDLTNGFDLRPEADAAGFKRTYRQIWARSFRIAMHIYWHHWNTITGMQLDGLLNAFTKHFVIFGLKFRMFTSWESVSAIYDLLSSILPPVYAGQLKDLRDGKKKAKGARRAAVRRRAYTELQERERPMLPLSRYDQDPEPPSPHKNKSKRNSNDEQREPERENKESEMKNEKMENKESESARKNPCINVEKSKPSEVPQLDLSTTKSKYDESPKEAITEGKAIMRANLTLDTLPIGNITRQRSGSSGSGSPRQKDISPREEERRKKGSRMQIPKDDLISALQRMKDPDYAGPNLSSPTDSPRGSGEPKTRGSEMPQSVMRFFTPPESPRIAEPEKPPLQSPKKESESPRRSKTISATSTSSADLPFPSIPPSFDVAKALADLTALDQEYVAFEEFHELEQTLLSSNHCEANEESKDIYSMISPRKNAKRNNTINSQEFEELRLQLQEQEKKRSRSWVTKRTSLPRSIQELRGSYVGRPPAN